MDYKFLPAATLGAVRSTYWEFRLSVRATLAHVVIDTFVTCIVFCGHWDIWTFVCLFYVTSREI